MIFMIFDCREKLAVKTAATENKRSAFAELMG
jgi:hypothetical protein